MISYSILIITCNQKEILGRALNSLAKQIKNPKAFEIVVADDCSTDGTDEFIKRSRMPIFLKYIRQDKNVGRSIIRNKGFEKTAGRQVIFLDGDMLPGDDMIESYTSSWEQYPGAVIVGSVGYPVEWPSDKLQKYLLSRGRLAVKAEGPVAGKYFTSGNFSIGRELFAEMRGFDLNFEGWKGEDTDFGLRLESKGVPIIFNPQAVSYHYHRKTIKEMTAEYDRYGGSSFRVLLEKYPGESIFETGWTLGLPGRTGLRKTMGSLLSPLRSDTAISILEYLANKTGSLFPYFCYDWLFYSCLARGYRRSLK